MSSTIEIDQLRVGMFIHLDLGWWAHPFALSSFLVTSADQIATIRGLGLKRLRWSPEKSQDEGSVEAPSESKVQTECTDDKAAQAPQSGAMQDITSPGARRRADLAAQRAADKLCAQQYGEAGRAWKDAATLLQSSPEQARVTTEGLTQSLLDKMMIDGEVCIRMLADTTGDHGSAHALNVTIISMLMGRVFGLSDAEMMDMGVGALMHDIGKLDLPERVRHLAGHLNPTEQERYREHVALGVLTAKRMGLTPGAMLVMAQHHEMADGSGFPQRLNIDRMAAAARIVSLVNRYDNLCNPPGSAAGLTPHEALSLIFAQARSKFDASMLNAFIRMMGVYPPGSLVQLTDDRYASVVSVNSSRPLKPRVLVCDPAVPPEQALVINLEGFPDLGVRRSLKAAQLPAAVHDYLSPRPRVAYFFEPATVPVADVALEMAA
jgi:putative nucleotidyltransferase with HDIG domain